MRVTNNVRIGRRAGGPLVALVVMLGCKDDVKHDTPDAAPSETNAASSERAEAPPADSVQVDAAQPPPAVPIASHPYMHGYWSSCTNGFRTSDQPQRDVTRLSLLCGPYQGMRRLGRTWLGHVGRGKDGSFEAHLRKGQCGRVFAAAGAELPSFRIVVSGPSGSTVARGQASRSFALANRDGAFCVEETGTFRVRLTAQQATGLVAAELWTLPKP